MWLVVGDPWILNPTTRAPGSLDFSWCNKREEHTILSRIDRAYLPLDWIGRVRKMEILADSFQSDHYLFLVELILGSTVDSQGSKANTTWIYLGLTGLWLPLLLVQRHPGQVVQGDGGIYTLH